MKFLVVSALAARVFSAAIPDGDRKTSVDSGLTRTFELPPLPTPSLPITWPWPREAEPESEAEAKAEAEAEALPKAYDSVSPDPSQVYITGLKYAGSGCPAGSGAYTLSDDRTTLTLLLSAYIASIGPGVAVTENRKNCQITFNLHYPSGFQYSVFTTTYRGYAALDAGVSGKQSAIYYFSGQTAQSTSRTGWTGPYNDNYALTDEAVSTSVVWSPCGQQGLLNINSAIQLTTTNKQSSGLLTTDSIDASFVQKLALRWQKC